MNVTCGTDIIEIDRIRNLIEDAKERALNKIFTDLEQEYCESKGNMKYQHYAVRFSAKEAIFKAVSNRLKDKFELSWTDVEILDDQNGRPEVKLINRKIESLKNIEISLSHCKEYAVATVVAIWEE
ncbi:MAG: holo-ACP synthase [Clostridia bacterium]|nr:holo-ACP synthase [Clostridia bacterium]